MTGRSRTLLRLLALRAGGFAATLAGAVAFVLLLLWLAPGDAIDVLPNGEELRPVLAEEWGLDQPLPQRYAAWVGRALQGDLGTSLTYRPGTPVTSLILGPALSSLAWAGAAITLSMLAGTALAWHTAGQRAISRTVMQVVSIAPLFLLAHLAVAGLNEAAWSAMQAGWIERPSWFALPDQASALRTTLAIALLAVGSGGLAEVHAEVEEALVRIRQSGFVDAARARGAPVWPHVVANLVPPLAGVATSRAAFYIGGLVVLEKVLLLNGVGAILWQAAQLRDHTLALGITVVLAAAVAALRLFGDAVRLVVDPRLAAEVET